jgi:hypothetical protein
MLRVLFIAMLWIAYLSPAEAVRLEKVEEQTLELEESVTRLVVSNVKGKLHISGTDAPNLEIKVNKYIEVTGVDSSELSDVVSQIQLVVETSGDTARVRMQLPEDRAFLQKIYGSSSHALRTHVFVKVPRRFGGHFTAISGDVQVSELQGPVHVALTRGSVRAENLGGDLSTYMITGELHTKAVAGAQSHQIREGKAKILDAAGKANINAKYATIHMEGSTGESSVDCEAGKVTIRKAEQPVQIQTLSASVESLYNRGDIQITTQTGPIRLALSRLQKEANVDLKSDSGALNVTVPRKFTGIFDLRTKKGRIQGKRAGLRVTSRYAGGKLGEVKENNNSIRFRGAQSDITLK